jgi:hypothetical protein
MPLVRLKRGYTYRVPPQAGGDDEAPYGGLKTYEDPPFNVPQSTYESHADIMELIEPVAKAGKKKSEGGSPEGPDQSGAST